MTSARRRSGLAVALSLSPTLEGGRSVSRRLPASRWALSLDLALAPGTSVAIGLGGPRQVLTLTRARRKARTAFQTSGARALPVPASRPRSRAGWIHLQAHTTGTGVKAALGDQRVVLPGRVGRRLSVSVGSGRVRLEDVIATSLADPAQLLLHRLADLQARVPRGRFLYGADVADRLQLRARHWTRGFLAGALWQAAALTSGSDPFRRWALQRTVANFGYERADSHDMGFVYGTSSLAGYRRTCRTARRRRQALCRRLRSSALSAARQLVALAATNPGGATIPTHAARPSALESDTIVDSLMNLPLLYWASDETGDQLFREVAARHAGRVASLLVRPDGSTAQSVHQDRLTGRVLDIHTHQGISASSTWARGQGWAVYGLTTSAAALGDPRLLSVAERAAGWVAAHLPPSGVPRRDYLLPAEAGDATSAGVITAAGLFRLSALCRRSEGRCTQGWRWRPLAERILDASLRHVSRSLPLGFFIRSADWDERTNRRRALRERVYGIYYGLEAVRLRRRAP